MGHVVNGFTTDVARRVRRAQGARRQRIPVSIPAYADRAAAVARDITHEGARVVSARSFTVGQMFGLKLLVPGGAPVTVAAETRWLDFHSSGRLYAMGVRFVHSPRSRGLLQSLAANLACGALPQALRCPPAARYNRPS